MIASKLKKYWPEIVVFALIIALLFWRLDSPGMVGDEATYSVRAWRWVDFLFSPYQTTPWQWFNPLPSWVFLSFHDAPPLAFWLQHAVFQIIGPSTWAARFPGVLAGILSVAAIYASLKIIFNRRVAFLGLILLACLTPFYWIQRSALLEPTMIGWLLTAMYCFFLARKQEWWYLAAGGFFGLALLTKYTALFVIPAWLLVIVWKRRQALASLKLWCGVGLVLIMQYPVVVYNILMYRSRGHADVQIAALLGQSNRDWPILTTHVNVNLIQSVVTLGRNILDLYSWPIVILVVVAGITVIVRKKYRSESEYWLLVTALLLCWVIFMALTRPNQSFISTGYFFVPFIVAPVVIDILKRRLIFLLLGILVVSYSLLYSIQTNYLPVRWGSEKVTYSSFAGRAYGLLAVEKYFAGLLEGKDSGIIFNDDYYQHFDPEMAQKKIFDFAKAQLASDKETFSDIIVYDQRINWFAEIWYFKRFFYFQRFPVMSSRDLYQLLENSPENYSAAAAGKKFYYFQIVDPNLLDEAASQDPINPQLEKILTTSATEQMLENQGATSFKLYIGRLP
ncbi:MAG: glycosyltransferase family 39 protein [Candidatus Komeilibacteria bacterium]